MNFLDFYNSYKHFKVKDFEGRYLPFHLLQTYLESLHIPDFIFKTEGYSELQKPISSVTFGHGSHKILVWSQMHGNESTTTKAILDLLSLLSNPEYSSLKDKIFNACTIKIIPMLNPDGSSLYTRVNFNGVDLNRDALDKSQKETKVFFKVLDAFKPDVCFNMHGQRTIFSAGAFEHPATMSFLAPSYNEERAINDVRKKAMQLIVEASRTLKPIITEQVSRYDDAFNENCFGDFLTKKGIPTILFEAGHFQHDYYRNETRKYVLISMLSILDSIVQDNYKSIDYTEYFQIPENKQLYCDIIIKNVKNSPSKRIGIQYLETLNANTIEFKPYIKAIHEQHLCYAHSYIDAHDSEVFINDSDDFFINQNIHKIKIGDREILKLLTDI
jgi:hypothetical protein